MGEAPASKIFFALNAQYDNFPGVQQRDFTGNGMPGHFDETTKAMGREATHGTGACSRVGVMRGHAKLTPI